MDVIKEPKVLVIAANPFSDINNNGKTLKSIFSQFRKENLCELYFRPQDNATGDGEYASSYYAVSELDIIRSINGFKRKCGGVQIFEKAKDIEIVEDKTYQKLLHGNLKNNAFLRSLLWKTRKWNTKEYREWYRECKPEIIFALLGGPSTSYTMALEISRELNIPLALYYTDDYLIHPLKRTLTDKIRYKRELPKYKKIVDYASIRFCIGDLMCEEYRQFFGKEFLPIMNLADIIPFESMMVKNEKLVLSYFGGLFLNRWQSLSKLADLVGDKGIVRIYSGNKLTEEMKAAFNKLNIQFMGVVNGDALKQAQLNSDILLHVESDSEEMRALTALSISTKIPEYLMSGRMILGFGPSEVASMRLISDNNLGIVLSADAPIEELKESVQNILTNEPMRIEYAKKGYQYAVEHFDKNKTAAKVKQLLTEIVSNYKKR